jgi:homocysteine S-methyltransferase
MITVEVVPPAGPDAEPILTALESLAALSFDGFSVATNPVAKPRLSALALCTLIQQRTGIQGVLWGARALGIETVLVATGDFVALGDRVRTTTVRDVDVFALVRLAREAGLHTGVVLDPHPESNGLEQAVRRLERKVEAGAQFAVTQPVYDEASARTLADATGHVGTPVLLGILPLRTARHAEFLHHRVAGIAVPEHVRERMSRASDSVAEGAANAREMLAVARQHFAGVCLMPPFDHYEVLFDILRS